MNYCTYCGNKIVEGTIFCAKCGTKVNNSGTTQANLEMVIPKSNYGHYFMETLKRPTSASDASEGSYGWIQFLLFITITTLSMYGILTGLVKITIGETMFDPYLGSGSEAFRIIRSYLVPRLFLANLTTFLAFVLAAFIVVKVAGNARQTFSQLLIEFGGLFSLNIFLLGIMSVLTLFFASEVTVIIAISILFLSFILCFTAYNHYIYSRINIRIYTLFLSNFLLVLLLAIQIALQAVPLINIFDEISYYF